MSDPLGAVLGALADPTRRSVVEVLLADGTTSVPALTERFRSIEQLAVVQQVAALEQAADRVCDGVQVRRHPVPEAGLLEPAVGVLPPQRPAQIAGSGPAQPAIAPQLIASEQRPGGARVVGVRYAGVGVTAPAAVLVHNGCQPPGGSLRGALYVGARTVRLRGPDQTEQDLPGVEDDRDGRGCRLCSESRGLPAGGNDHCHADVNETGRQSG